jgi:hypothetical protein
MLNEGTRPLERRRRTWEDNIKVHLRETGWEDVHLDASGSGWVPCEHGTESSGSVKGGTFLTSWMTISFPRRILLH